MDINYEDTIAPYCTDTPVHQFVNVIAVSIGVSLLIIFIEIMIFYMYEDEWTKANSVIVINPIWIGLFLSWCLFLTYNLSCAVRNNRLMFRKAEAKPVK